MFALALGSHALLSSIPCCFPFASQAPSWEAACSARASSDGVWCSSKPKATPSEGNALSLPPTTRANRNSKRICNQTDHNENHRHQNHRLPEMRALLQQSTTWSSEQTISKELTYSEGPWEQDNRDSVLEQGFETSGLSSQACCPNKD